MPHCTKITCNSLLITLRMKLFGISRRYKGTVPLHQLFKLLHKIDIILDKVQVANTPRNQHSSGVKLLKLYKN